jgi:SNF2 family DNA or RNA helicase
MTQGLIKRVLIICPLSIMYSAWQADIFKTAMHRSVAVAYGDANKRKKVINGIYEFVIINYDGVGIVAEDISKLGFDLIVIDEANAYKTATTKRFKTMAKILKPSTKLWMLTGTPASQSPLDAFGLAKLVNPGGVPKYFTAWRDKVMHQITRFKYVPKPTSRQDVYNALQPAIRFEKAQCLDLPPVMYQTREIPLTPQVSRYYNAIKNQMLIEAAGEKISAVNAAAKLTKLLQISGGAVYTDTREVVEFDVSPRLNALMEVLDETEHKVIVFVPYRHTIELVSKHLQGEGVTNEIISGDVGAKERGDLINRFQTSEFPRVLIIQPQAASHGVTLTAANTVVFWSPVMSVETYLQCIARIDRYGQQNKMTVVHLQGSEVERKMYQMLQGKVTSHEKLVDLYKEELGIKDE